MAEEVSELKNKVTELEDEKGNLQLRLVDYDEVKAQIGRIWFDVNLTSFPFTSQNNKFLDIILVIWT